MGGGESHFLESFHYAATEMRRALMEASQFAHVSEAEIDHFMIWAYANMSTTDAFLEARVCPEIPKVFRANHLIRRFEEEFGHLCPVCQCVIQQEEDRKPAWYRYSLMPSWLTYRSLNDHNDAHCECEDALRSLVWETDRVDRGDIGSAKRLAAFFTRKGHRHDLVDLLESRAAQKPPLRIDPSTVTRTFNYADTRDVRDISDEEIIRLMDARRPKRRRPASPWDQVHRKDLSNFC